VGPAGVSTTTGGSGSGSGATGVTAGSSGAAGGTGGAGGGADPHETVSANSGKIIAKREKSEIFRIKTS
jgi:hypothetical protein